MKAGGMTDRAGLGTSAHRIASSSSKLEISLESRNRRNVFDHSQRAILTGFSRHLGLLPRSRRSHGISERSDHCLFRVEISV